MCVAGICKSANFSGISLTLLPLISLRSSPPLPLPPPPTDSVHQILHVRLWDKKLDRCRWAKSLCVSRLCIKYPPIRRPRITQGSISAVYTERRISAAKMARRYSTADWEIEDAQSSVGSSNTAPGGDYSMGAHLLDALYERSKRLFKESLGITERYGRFLAPHFRIRLRRD